MRGGEWHAAPLATARALLGSALLTHVREYHINEMDFPRRFIPQAEVFNVLSRPLSTSAREDAGGKPCSGMPSA